MSSFRQPTWDQYYMRIASVVSSRSHDPSTKHGAIIADAQHRPLGFGYNGFPAGGDDSCYTTERPGKYRCMIHAEVNAILNSTRRCDGATLYVTGLPCANCMLIVVQSGIKRVVYGAVESAMIDKDHESFVFAIARNHGIEMVEHHL